MSPLPRRSPDAPGNVPPLGFALHSAGRRPPAVQGGHPAVSTSSHRDLIVDQFTRQATPFSTAKTIASEEALHRLVEACGAGPSDSGLGVACGGGLGGWGPPGGGRRGGG